MLALPRLKHVASPNYSSRGGQKTRLFVFHDCEGSYAGSVNWFTRAEAKVSAHWVLAEDGSEATLMVDPANKAWHACNANPYSEALEMGGFSAKGFDAPEWKAAAAVGAYRMRALGVPCQWAQHGEGAGFCSHSDLGAFGGGHHDPMDPTEGNPVWAQFCALLKEAYDQDMPSSWPGEAAEAPPVPAGFKPRGSTRHDLAEGSLEWIQAHLNASGAARPLLLVDGLMGPAARRAVQAFQQTHGLYIDGIAGPKTIAALAAV